jgi:hypothetical protein
MRNLKSWVFVVALLASAIWLVAEREPSKLASADPTAAFSVMDVQSPSELPSAEGGNAY